MAVCKQVQFVMTKQEYEFLEACCNVTNGPIWSFVEGSFKFFKRMAGEAVVDTFKKKDNDPRDVKMFVNLPMEDYELLKELSDTFHISYSEVLRISMLYNASMNYIIPLMTAFIKEFGI